LRLRQLRRDKKPRPARNFPKPGRQSGGAIEQGIFDRARQPFGFVRVKTDLNDPGSRAVGPTVFDLRPTVVPLFNASSWKQWNGYVSVSDHCEKLLKPFPLRPVGMAKAEKAAGTRKAHGTDFWLLR
jgi:hypothetical protein